MIRLDKALAHLGYGSRKDVKELIKKGFVRVNEEVIINCDHKISNDDAISVYDENIKYDDYVYYLINKPSGYLSATISDNYPTVLELVPYRAGLFPVGRLDLDTEGLLIITNDGQLAHKLLSPKLAIEKEYYFQYSGSLLDDAISRCLAGINIDGEYVTKPSKLKLIGDNEGKIILTEGKYHEVKRIIRALGGEVIYLKRIRMKELVLGDLKVGCWRKLNDEEIQKLKD